jgi:dipeptidyl aminopeptidase/acylaminoacyl peptidase
MKRIIRLLIFGLLSLFLCTLFGLCMVQAVFTVFPHRTTATRTPEDVDITNYENITIKTADGLTLVGWYIPPTRANGASLLLIHGHAGNRGMWLDEARFFADMGYGLLLFDMRHNGESEGRITTMGLREVRDVQVAYDFLRQQPEVNPQRIAIYGGSMGGATAVLVFNSLPDARILMVDASFADYRSLLADNIRKMNLSPLFFPDIIIIISNIFSGANLYNARPIDAIAQVNKTVFIMHGSTDWLIPMQHSQRLFAAAHNPKQFMIIEGANHGDVFETDPETYAAHVVPFLDQYLNN